jgi:hypothetical protein
MGNFKCIWIAPGSAAKFFGWPTRTGQSDLSTPRDGTELDGHAFAGGIHFQRGSMFPHQGTGAAYKAVNLPVVVLGVVVEKDELPDAGLQREHDRILHATMSPAGVLRVFGVVVLGIENQDVGIANKVNHQAVIPAGTRLRVREKTDESVGRQETIAHAKTGMVGALGANENIADREIEFAQLFNLNITWQLGEGHGKIGAFHLAGERSHQAPARPGATENPQAAAGIIYGRKKWQALDMIPMRVRNEQGKVERFVLEFSEQRPPEQPQSGAGIENNDVVARPDLNAGGIPPIAQGAAAGGGSGTTNAPEFYDRAAFDGTNLAQHQKK